MNTRVLTEADAAADLAGLPRPGQGRPVSSDEALKTADLLPAFEIAGLGKAVAADACDMLRTLVSERDALAVRVAELEAALQGFYRNSNRHDWPADIYDAATAALPDPLEKLTRISEELGLYDDITPTPESKP